MTSQKWVIIHGHFYQPPRENPWLDSIERQESAHPFHDWNERIYSQCYRPNGYSRLLNEHGMITGINNNYEFLSFNFGPTLLSWIERYHPVTLKRIIEGDHIGQKRLEGHGNAIAQVYNHMILPLASRRDKLTQIRWAKAAFRKSFGREAKGIWLAETAINMETVQCLIEEHIAFIILSPSQAEAVRPLKGHHEWSSCGTHGPDTRRPYRLFTTNGGSVRTGGHIDVFFFDEGLSKEISFDGLLQSAERFGERINKCYSSPLPDDEVVVIATDGETFGHHKPFADMCLAYFLRSIAPALNIRPVNFSHYRAHHPPLFEVRIKNALGEGTAWSCAHGVGRWSRDCGCNTGGEPTWNQAWRGPLRTALDNLQRNVDAVYISTCATSGIDPWKLRDWNTDRYNDFRFERWKKALADHFPEATVTNTQGTMLRRLLDAQRYMLFSFTSCGWFFSELSGIEPMQNLAFACRALQLGIPKLQHQGALDTFISDLSHAKSNIGNDTGASLFSRHILPHFNHNHIIAFAVSIEKLTGCIPGTTLKQNGYACSVEQCSGSRPDSHLFRISIASPRYGDFATYAVGIEGADSGVLHGLVAETAPDSVAGITSVNDVRRMAEAQQYRLSALFPSLRETIANVYVRKIGARSFKPFGTWFSNNEKELHLLESFVTPVPAPFFAPATFVLQERWDTLFRTYNLSSDADLVARQLEPLYATIKAHGITIDLSFSAACCEERLTAELAMLHRELSNDRCDTITKLMDIVDLYALPIAKHRLEDIFFPILDGPVRAWDNDTKNSINKKIDDEIQEKINKILKFAQRMNFAADAFLQG